MIKIRWVILIIYMIKIKIYINRFQLGLGEGNTKTGSKLTWILKKSKIKS